MATHQLKTWPEQFHALASGLKLHEVRVDDRGFAVGDTLVLVEFDPEFGEYSGRRISALVTWITKGGEFGLPHHLCVMSLGPRLATKVVR